MFPLGNGVDAAGVVVRSYTCLSDLSLTVSRGLRATRQRSVDCRQIITVKSSNVTKRLVVLSRD